MSATTVAEEDRAAGLTAAAPWRVRELTVLPGHRLALDFFDGAVGIAHLSTLVTIPNAGLFAALADPAEFARVAIILGAPT